MELNNAEKSQAKILFVDDETSVLKSLRRLSRGQGWEAHIASSAEEGLRALCESNFDVIVSDMRMPGMTGDTFLTEAKELAPESVRILLTGYSDMSAVESAINNAKIYNYLTKPWDEDKLCEVLSGAIEHHAELIAQANSTDASAVQNKKLSKLALLLDKQVKERSMEVDQALGLLDGLNDKAEQNFQESLGVLTLILEWKEGRDCGHLEFVSTYGVKIAEKLDLSKDDIKAVGLAGNLHRIGMLYLPDELRQKPIFNLNEEEKKLFQKHPIWGEMALSNSQNLAPIGKIIRHQHEYVNGTGFPDGLIYKDIPIASKIIAVASDFYYAYNGRMERNISGKEEAINYMTEWTGKKYDQPVVNALLEVIEDFGDNEIRRMILLSEDLKENMRLETDIVSKNGTILLTEGTILTDASITKLIEFEKKYHEELNFCVETENTNEENTK